MRIRVRAFRSPTRARVAILALACLLPCKAVKTAQLPPSLQMSRGVIVNWYSAPRTAMAGDCDGDGRADFIGYFPLEKGIVDLARMSPAGKLFPQAQAHTQAGEKAVAVACGRFSAEKGVGVLLLFPDGSLRYLHDLKLDTQTFSRSDTVGCLPADQKPKEAARLIPLDADGDGKLDAVMMGSDGRLLLLHNRGEENQAPQLQAIPLESLLPRVRRISAGDLDGDGRDELVWLDRSGALYRASVELSGEASGRLVHRFRLAKGAPYDGLAVGRFAGSKTADILMGQHLLPGGNVSQSFLVPNLPTAKKAKGDCVWIAADFDGDGKDDLIRAQRSGDPLDGDHVYLHYAFNPQQEPDAPFADTDNDGLLNAWENGKMKPGGLDLAALGCTTTHPDLIVELQRFEDVPEDKLRAEMDRVIRYYASLPVSNLDGSKGIALHVIFREPIPLVDLKSPWWEVGEKYHPAGHRGITHWMQVSMSGGGQSGEMADRGGCGFYGFYATFIHEFGHQIGLGHTGRWGPAWCPTYCSLMNYAYNYQFNGKGEDIRYSQGLLASVILRENRLSEILPLPVDKVSFLSGPPYRYRLKSAPEGKTTWIDWNWNGVFGEKGIAADINYGYSTSGGLRHTIGKTYAAPAVVSHGAGVNARLLLFCGRLPEGAPVPPSDATAKQPGLSPDQPGCLCLRIWKGTDPERDGPKWSDEITIEAAGVTGDPSATHWRGDTWVSYPSSDGIRLRRITLDQTGNPQIGNPLVLPDSKGDQPTLTPFGDGLALLLWRDDRTAVRTRLLFSWPGGQLILGPTSSLRFNSVVPVGAVAGASQSGKPTLWIGLMQDIPGGFPGRWQVRQFLLEEDGFFRQLRQEWIGGDKGGERGSSRVMLLREPNPAFGTDGQLYFIACGLFGKDTPWSCHYVATRIADGSINGGWLTRRYYDEWTQSRSASGVCFFRGDIALAVRWFGNVHGTENDNLFVAFYGKGIESAPMGDFDDMSFIRAYGLACSIPNVSKP
ncbi:MAG: VCBS repeat-containing protein [Armatimonadetes bacterium]|nr:VCBS repeat-containing protein [Armatimonadota bacterium]